ncbi:DUF2911 domain-containing protein [Flavobacterium sp.]|jgi:tetratricopeptide (TPR) repeat protein|uniref:DUF2911 domain-containing protein n=1 Tax=Flavobacterium sp. TaxID=239 RepID=UPI0037BFA809
MKKIIYLFAFVIANFAIEAQVKTPQASPKSVLTQVVGLTDVTVEYSRPSAKGRTVFGNLVPFGELWRTGANANSTVSFSEDVIINGTTLKKGKYAIFTIPKADMWEVDFYVTNDNWGLPENWDEKDVAARTNVNPIALGNNVETFTMAINNITNDSATLDISWEKTMVSIKFEVPTQKTALASIDKVLAGPTAGDYFSSAQYFYQSNGDLNKALTYINKALELNKDKPFWYNRLKSLIQAKLGDKKGAIETAKLSLVAATEAKNNDYVKMNNDSIAEWSKK